MDRDGQLVEMRKILESNLLLTLNGLAEVLD